AVIGTGTAFVANSRVGDAFLGPDGGWYEVTNIASDSAMSIAPNYQGPTQAAGVYSLAPMQGYVKDSADALRAATQVIASGVADMQEQVAVATEAAALAGQSKTSATEQAGIAISAAQTSTENKDAAQQAAQQSGTSAQASGTAADRAEAAKTSIIQSEQAAAASATAAAESAAHAEEVTLGKAVSGDNNDITSLRALTADGFDRLRQGIAPMVGATATIAGAKGLVPAASVADRLNVLSGAGTWVPLPTGAAWGAITGTLSAQTDLQTALNSKLSILDSGGTNTNGWIKYSDGTIEQWGQVSCPNSGLTTFSFNAPFTVAVKVFIYAPRITSRSGTTEANTVGNSISLTQFAIHSGHSVSPTNMGWYAKGV
ncbi:MAG: hypothetical protein WBI95_04070, partial [Pseudomonas veronii]|uniref:hypothetical protein n=1 Tax=Pseudomonas veronii TaxID=76761 RepID=UPI003C768A03